tara:strand:+ start:4797 stop:5732 length:936 start_codon:yes stop_codon:yes gene_type:complete
MKTLITAPAYFADEAVRTFKSFSSVQFVPSSKEMLLSFLSDCNVLAIRVDTVVDREVLDAAPNLKVVATATSGLNHIDMEYAKEKGVKVISLQGANTTSTAEHVFALLFSLLRKVNAAHSHVLSGEWERHQFIGSNLSGKTIGVVGFGRIGQHVGDIAKALGMKVLAYDPYLSDHVFAEKGAKEVSFEDLLRESDVVTSHMLLTEETGGMFCKDNFSLMKNSAVFINCSRGGVVVEDDLLLALQEDVIAGAALDTFVREPISKNHKFISYAKENDNLLLTPHIAGSTKESVHLAGLNVAEETRNYFQKVSI